MARRNRRIKLSKAVKASDPAFAVGDSVLTADGTTGTVKKAVDVTAYQIEDENGDTLPWEIEDDLSSDSGQQLSRGRKMAKRSKKSTLSPKQLRKARKILNLEDDVELTDSEILSRLISVGKLNKAAKAGLGEDDDELEDDEDDDEIVDVDDPEDDDEDEEDDDEAEDALDDDEEEDDEDEDEGDDDDEATNKRRDKKGRRRQQLLAGRRNRRVRELAGSVGSLSRVPKTDPATMALIKRSLKTERRRAIERGAITPEIDMAIADLLFTKGKPNALALSRVGGSNEPLAFRIYDILRKNKPTPVSKGERSGSQEQIALSRKVPGSKGEKREVEQLRDEVRGFMAGQRKPGKPKEAPTK